MSNRKLKPVTEADASAAEEAAKDNATAPSLSWLASTVKQWKLIGFFIGVGIAVGRFEMRSADLSDRVNSVEVHMKDAKEEIVHSLDKMDAKFDSQIEWQRNQAVNVAALCSKNHLNCK
jgi:hypothetical protein